MSDEVISEAHVFEDEASHAMKRMMGMLDCPAYLRRAQRVELSIGLLLERCEKERQILFDHVRVPWRQWNRARREDPKATVLSPTLGAMFDEVSHMLLREEDAIESRVSGGRASSIWHNLSLAVSRFNERWRRYVDQVNTTATNELIDGYNRYYLFEKECAFRNGMLAARGYKPLPKFDASLLLEKFPLLPELPPRIS